jgi:hypothetical protein
MRGGDRRHRSTRRRSVLAVHSARTFTAALFAGGSSVSIVGSGGLEPDTEMFRLFYFLAALVGTAVTSLVLTYLMRVYTALLAEYVRLRTDGHELDVELAHFLGYTPEQIDVSA